LRGTSVYFLVKFAFNKYLIKCDGVKTAPGYEFAGVVVSVGDQVKKFKEKLLVLCHSTLLLKKKYLLTNHQI
jgi:NADPH:quinone reductase-like Zn-dependent oxidoreductase